MQQPVDLGETLSKLMDMFLQIMKETDPEGYKQFRIDNEKFRKARLAREAKQARADKKNQANMIRK